MTIQRKMPAALFIETWQTLTIPTGWEDYIGIDEDMPSGELIIFRKIVIEDEVFIQNNDQLPAIELEDCVLNNLIVHSNLQKGAIRNISLTKTTTANIELIGIGGAVYLVGCKTAEVILHNYLSPNGSRLFIEGSTTEGISVKGKSAINLVTLSDSTIKYLEIKDSQIAEGVFLDYAKLDWLSIKDSATIGTFSCFMPFDSPAQINFEDSNFKKIKFENTSLPEFTNFSSTNCTVKELSIRNFSNNGTAFFSGLKPTVGVASIIRLVDSDLGKTLFINCDLVDFVRFEFQNTKMLDVFLAGSKIPDASKFNLFNEENLTQKGLELDKLKAQQTRLAYGQFKKIYENRGDVAASLQYAAFEMDAYRKQLQMDGWLKNAGELTMLWLNKLSTNYGNRWSQGLLWTFGSIIFFFALFLGAIGYPVGNFFSCEDWKRAFALFSYAPYFINPLRDSDSIALVKDETLSDFARYLDFFSRIVVAYFAYQTIQAFRKLGKSSG